MIKVFDGQVAVGETKLFFASARLVRGELLVIIGLPYGKPNQWTFKRT